MLVIWICDKCEDGEHTTKDEIFCLQRKVLVADECTSPMNSNKQDSLVPIIVGCSLAGLIVIVLIAYLLGRRKAPRGYDNI
eukprot:gene16746-8205_t